MKKIYIAGKINGLKNYREVFKAAEDKLVAEGNAVMNPAVLGEGFDYEVYLPICLLMLQSCDVIYMLNNWSDSKGAKVELNYAKAQGKEIIYQANPCNYEKLQALVRDFRRAGYKENVIKEIENIDGATTIEEKIYNLESEMTYWNE